MFLWFQGPWEDTYVTYIECERDDSDVPYVFAETVVDECRICGEFPGRWGEGEQKATEPRRLGGFVFWTHDRV